MKKEEIWAKGFGKFLKAAKSMNFWVIEGGINREKVMFGLRISAVKRFGTKSVEEEEEEEKDEENDAIFESGKCI
ncbi:hypothetical protein FXO38_09679 [Capsicum annuum]|nr:hypothetical protein FXO38_09679 [Capsicum annuum]KAF3677373.1 hypothetical protein FXO37_04875 [Capsicum annuum]